MYILYIDEPNGPHYEVACFSQYTAAMATFTHIKNQIKEHRRIYVNKHLATPDTKFLVSYVPEWSDDLIKKVD